MLSFRRRSSNGLAALRTRQRPRRARRLAGVERLEDRLAFSGMPYGAMPDDTAEFMLGEVYVTVVLMESSSQTGPLNNNSETWTQSTINTVKQRVTQGLQWWEDTLATKTDKHELNFQIDFTYADTPVETSYEPITRSSNDSQIWIYDFLSKVGYNTRGNFHSDIRAYNHAQRIAHGTDWAYTIIVVNDEHDSDHQFAPGGFSKAFAFAGGEFLVSLGSRPNSTYSHETGHIFWALDEYQPDGNYNRNRGYYNTQNLNSWDNPAAGFVQKPSIMAKDALLNTAYNTHTSAPTSLEVLGWKDSDNDGIFDVLDVPLTLSGSGYYDATGGEYHFTGTSAVQTLPNKNTAGLRNDITINNVSRAQFRIDGGAWQTAAEFGTFSADMHLHVPVPANATTVEIRTIDDTTGVTSPIFQGLTSRPSSVLTTGISGVVWSDTDGDGALDANEQGLADVGIQLVDDNGLPLQLRKSIEPDDYESGNRINNVEPAVTLSGIGSGVADDTVAAFVSNNTSTGDRLFASFSSSCGGYCVDWTTESRQLRMDFTNPVSTLSLDAIGSSPSGIARLEAFGADNQLIARYTTRELSSGQIEKMTINQSTANIKYAIARSHNNTVIRFDNLQFGPQSTATTDANGTYTIAYLNEGQYRVQVIPALGQNPTNPAGGNQNVVLGEGEAKSGVDFGLETSNSRWQNPGDRFDVNDDGILTSNDVLRIINKLNTEGAGPLDESDASPPYVDVNGDFNVTSNDVLQVINELNRRSSGGGGEGEGAGFARVEVERKGASEIGEPGRDAEGEFAIWGPALSEGIDRELAATENKSSRRIAQIPLAPTALPATAVVQPPSSPNFASDPARSPRCGDEVFDSSDLLLDDDLVTLLATSIPS